MFCHDNPSAFTDADGRDPDTSVGSPGDLPATATLSDLQAYAEAHDATYSDPNNKRHYDPETRQWKGGILHHKIYDPDADHPSGFGDKPSDFGSDLPGTIPSGPYQTSPNPGPSGSPGGTRIDSRPGGSSNGSPSGSPNATGSGSGAGDNLFKRAARGFLSGVLGALAAVVVIAALPFEIPAAVVGGLIALTAWSAVQTIRRRNPWTNKPISTGDAVEQGAAILGGFAGGFLGSELPSIPSGPSPVFQGGGGGTVTGTITGSLTPSIPAVAVGGITGSVAGMFSNSTGEGGGEEDPGAEIKRLSDGEIEKLKKAGYDIHDLKGEVNASKYDLFKDSDGNIWVKLKSGKGEAESYRDQYQQAVVMFTGPDSPLS